MNLAILWIDLLATNLIWVIFWAACSARIKRRWLRNFLMTMAVACASASIASIVVLSALFKFAHAIEPSHFTFSASLAVAFVICVVPLLGLAFKWTDGVTPAAATWRPAPWLLALIASISIGYMVILNMDFAVRARCAIASLELKSEYLAMLPAVTSEESNAAPLYDEAFSQLDAAFEDERKVFNPPTGNNQTFDPNEPATLSYLNEVAPTLALLRQAASLPACRFDADLHVQFVPMDELMSGLTHARNAANVLALDAYESNSRGNIARSLDDVTAILRMSRHIGQRPALVSALVGLGIDAMGHEVLKQTFPLVTSQEQLEHLHMDHLMPMARIMRLGLISDEGLGAVFYGDMFTAPSGRTPGAGIYYPSTGTEGVLFHALLLDVDTYLEFMADVQDRIAQPAYLLRQHVQGMDDRARHSFLIAILAPSFERLPKILGRAEASDSCGTIAVAMTRYRLDHGRWPTELAVLVPKYLAAIPLDPFDGKPLRLVTRDGVPILYSVDFDGIDNEGADPVKSSKGKGDWTYTLEPTTRPTTKPSP